MIGIPSDGDERLPARPTVAQPAHEERLGNDHCDHQVSLTNSGCGKHEPERGSAVRGESQPFLG
jgi:hypothetical protein